jgi:excinuclease ABC subunit C
MDKSVFRTLPDSPGVYIFRDKGRTPLYIGKAIDLRKRVEQHFSGPPVDYREQILREASNEVEIMETRNEVEALILENNLIKRFRPKLNVMLKDDKSYPYIKVTKEKFPRVVLTRRLLNDGGLYFGPYTSPTAARLTIKQLRRAFPIRTCSLDLDGAKLYKPCLDYHLKLCRAPCASHVSQEEYAKLVQGFASVLRGSYKRVLSELYSEMLSASHAQKYETAAAVRDRIIALEKLNSKQYAQLPGWADYDVVAARRDAGVVLHFRRGALVGREVLRLSTPDGVAPHQLLIEFVQLFYSAGRMPAVVVLAQLEGEERNGIEKWLRTKNPETVLRPPKTRLEKLLLEMCYANLPAVTKAEALEELKKVLGLNRGLSVIHGFDVSNIGSSNPYVSAVCFVAGEPSRKNYRVYGIKGVKKQNDFAMIREAVVRHLKHVDKGDIPAPDLVLIDGGKVQLAYAIQALRLSHKGNLPIVSIAKREEVLFSANGRVIRLPKSSGALQLLQFVRDESHRFALKHHRKSRRKQSLSSLLTGIKGLGPVRRAALTTRYPTNDSLRKAKFEDLCKIPGISGSLALRIREALSSQ